MLSTFFDSNGVRSEEILQGMLDDFYYSYLCESFAINYEIYQSARRLYETSSFEQEA